MEIEMCSERVLLIDLRPLDMLSRVMLPSDRIESKMSRFYGGEDER